MAGKYTPGEGIKVEPGRRANFDFPPIDKEKADRIVVAMREIAKKHGVSVALCGPDLGAAEALHHLHHHRRHDHGAAQRQSGSR